MTVLDRVSALEQPLPAQYATAPTRELVYASTSTPAPQAGVRAIHRKATSPKYNASTLNSGF